MISPRRFLLLFTASFVLAVGCAGTTSSVTSSNEATSTEVAPTVTPPVETPEPQTDSEVEPEPTSVADNSAESGDATAEPEPEPSPEPTSVPVPKAAAAVTSLDGISLEFTTAIATTSAPLAIAAHPDGESLLVAEKDGSLRRWIPRPDSTYERLDPPVLDLTDRVSGGAEQGLLGMAVAPAGDFIYLAFTDLEGDSRVIETSIDGIGERELLAVSQPFSNHNGGHLAFGPDGYLYVGLGDGGSAGDPLDTGQDVSDLLGSILRIAPNPGGATYAIPSDNPFLNDTAARPEVWAYGLRNPWRFSFDSATGDLWIADVGQDEIEEIDLLRTDAPPGANFGWPAFEGTAAFRSIPADGAIGPVYEYDNGEGCSITGGYVARNNNVAIEGVYLYGDYCSQTVFGLIVDDSGAVVDTQPIGSVDGGLVSFGVGHDGELFVLLDSGVVQRITVG